MAEVTLRIEYRLSEASLVNALCWTRRSDEPGDELPTWSKAQIEREVRDVLTFAGVEDIDYWADAFNDLPSEMYTAHIDRISGWALKCIHRVWPGLASADHIGGERRG